MREPKFTDRKYKLLMKHQRGDAFAADYNAWQKEQMAEALARSTRESHRQAAVAKQHQKDSAKAAERTKWQADKDAAVAKQQQKYAAKAAERAAWQAGKDAALAREAANKAQKAEYVRGRDVKSKMEPEGQTSTYFGGIGKPDGPKHGHIVSDADGNITYDREPKK